MKRKHSKKQHDLMTSSEKLKKGYDIFETFITHTLMIRSKTMFSQNPLKWQILRQYTKSTQEMKKKKALDL